MGGLTVKCPKVCERFYTMTFESYRACIRVLARERTCIFCVCVIQIR